MSVHVLRHVTKDVMRLQRPADQFSCFWGENALKKIKNLTNTRKEPLVNLTKGLRSSGAVFDKHDSAKFIPRFMHRLSSGFQEGGSSNLIGFRGIQTEKFRLVGSSVNNRGSCLRTTTDFDDHIQERPLTRTKDHDDENAYFFAKDHIYKTIYVWKTILPHSDPKNDAQWTNETDVYIEAQRYATLSEAYHINYGEEAISSDVVGIWYFGGLQKNYLAKIKLSDIKHKVVVHLIDGQQYAYKIL